MNNANAVAVAREEIVEAHAAVVQLQKELGVPRGQLCKLPLLIKKLPLETLEQHIAEFDSVASKTRTAIAEKVRLEAERAEREAAVLAEKARLEAEEAEFASHDPIKVMMRKVVERAAHAEAVKKCRVAQAEAYRFEKKLGVEQALRCQLPKNIGSLWTDCVETYTAEFAAIANRLRPEVAALAEAAAQAAAEELARQAREAEEAAAAERARQAEVRRQLEVDRKLAEARRRHEKQQRLLDEHRRLRSAGKTSAPLGVWLARRLAEPMRKTG